MRRSHLLCLEERGCYLPAPMTASTAPSPAPSLDRRCARPGCTGWPTATLSYRYAERRTVIVPLAGERPPQTYDLCGLHADRTRPPSGWTLEDRRAAPAEVKRSAPTHLATVPDDARAPEPETEPLLPPSRAASQDTVARSDAVDEPVGLELELDLGPIDRSWSSRTARW